MEACTGPTEGAMDDIIPTIMSALSLNDTVEEEVIERKSSGNASTVRRRQQHRRIISDETPSVRKTGESSRRQAQQEQHPNRIEKELPSSNEGMMDDIIPTIMNAFSFQDTSEVPIRKTESRRRRGLQDQQPNSTEKELPSSNEGMMDDIIPTIMNAFSFQDTSEVPIRKTESRRRRGLQDQQPNSTEKELPSSNEGTMEDIVPTIMNALSFHDNSEEIRRRNRTDNSASRRLGQQNHTDSIEPSVQITPVHKTESSHRRRLQQQQEHQPNHVKKSLATDAAEEDNLLEAFPALMEVCSTNDDGQSTTYEKTVGVQSNGGVFKSERDIVGHNMNPDETVNRQIDRSIRNLMDDDGTKENGMSPVQPFGRSVFSFNDIGINFTLNSTQEISDGTEEVGPTISSRRDEEIGNESQRKNKPTQKILVTRAYEVKEHYLESIFYVSISAILGSVFRVYMARLFGFDCQYKQLNDFLVPLSNNICVTNDGRSEQTGGALFIDFPSNVFGSFLMGMITPPVDKRRARLPWLHRDHPLQRDEVFHTSLGIGFCGCLTTFASWNTQMVVMLDGTFCELGSQVVTVLFGYFIGLMGASYGFQLGRQCGLWMYNYRHRDDDDDEKSSHRDRDGVNESGASDGQDSLQSGVGLPDEGVELVDDDNVMLQPEPSHLHKIPLFLTAVALLVAFIIGDVVNGIEFYKGMTLLWILSPVGSLLRWRLSNLNVKKSGRIISISPDWIPWGTFFANLLATILSACMEGLNNRYFSGDNPTSTNQWVDAMLFALKTGVAGSLSTVSTMVKESVLLSENYPGQAQAYYYSVFTCVTCCLLGLVVYATTIRLGV